MAKRIAWPPPQITARRWQAMPLAERVELVGAVEEVGEAVVAGLEQASLVVEEHLPGKYRCRPA